MNSCAQEILPRPRGKARRIASGLGAACLWLPLVPLLEIAVFAAAHSTVYVNRHFEVRHPDQPIKHVFNGEQRVATVTASLTAGQRVQRVRVRPGWNLVSVAVDGSTFPQGDETAPAQAVTAVFRFDATVGQWVAVLPQEILPARIVLWAFATADAVLPLRGETRDPAEIAVAGGGTFVPVPVLGAWTPPRVAPGTELWTYGAVAQEWQVHFPPTPDGPDPAELAPGGALFIRSVDSLRWAPPDPGLAVRYHHPDHLGSATVVTDVTGGIVEETIHYPFGGTRLEVRSRLVDEPYDYTQKERDRETGLHYFETRYLAAALARFTRPDFKYASIDSLPKEDRAAFLADPQNLNLYAYVRNNPIRFIDPLGEEAVPAQAGSQTLTLTLKDAVGGTLNLPVSSASLPEAGRVTGVAIDQRHREPSTEIALTRTSDRHSVTLSHSMAEGRVFQEATLIARGPGKAREELFRIKLTDVMISSMTVSGGRGGRPVDWVVLSGTRREAIFPKSSQSPGPIEPQATRFVNHFAPKPTFDADKAAAETARQFQEILSGRQFK